MVENFGKYQLIEKIAEGGMAELYLAKSSKFQGLEKYLIIKRILPCYSGSGELVKMFINEAKINMNMSHSNIVSIFDFGIENGRFFIAMEYVQGQNLRGLLKMLAVAGSELSISEKIYIVAQAAAGLDYSHRCKDIVTSLPLNIIHRDVSPENIMVNFEGNIKIIDFGVAVDSETNKRSAHEGKFSYMSPEQANAEDGLTAQTDIFSLGVVLWELLANTRMYTGSTRREVLRMAEKAEYKDIRRFNGKVSDELSIIVKKALEKEVANRYQSMNDFYIDLNKYLNINYPEFTTGLLKDKVSSVCQEGAVNIQKMMESTTRGSVYETAVHTVNYGDATVVSDKKERRKITGKTFTKKKKRIKKAS
ncbi:MAG: serine/threonine protein kinase [Bdellovibrionales bacterium]